MRKVGGFGSLVLIAPCLERDMRGSSRRHGRSTRRCKARSPAGGRRRNRVHSIGRVRTADRRSAPDTAVSGEQGHVRAQGSQNAVDVVLDVVEVERDPKARVTGRRHDLLLGERSDKRVGSVETTQISGPYSRSPVPSPGSPSSSSPYRSRSTSPCSRSRASDLRDQLHPRDAG